MGDQLRKALRAQSAVFFLQPLPFAQRAAKLDLRFKDGGETRVVPRLLNEIAGAAAHRFHRQLHRSPGRHHDHRQRCIQIQNSLQQLKPFLAGGCVACVVQVHQDRVEVARFNGMEGGGGSGDGFRHIAFGFDQQAEGFQHVRLVVGNQDPGPAVFVDFHSILLIAQSYRFG